MTNEEKDIIDTLYNEHGSCWTLISNKLKGRTQNMIKNYWYGTHCKWKYRKARGAGKIQGQSQNLPELEPDRRIRGFPSDDEINLVREKCNLNAFGLWDMNSQWTEIGVTHKNLIFSDFDPYKYDFESLQPPKKKRRIMPSFKFERKKWHRLENEIMYVF